MEQRPVEDLNILVVDDDLDTRERLSNILTRRGYKVFLAENGVEGLEVARHHVVDVVFCDLIMPHMDGLEFLTKMRELTLKAEIIIVSGLPTVEALAESVEKNVVEFLIKPLTIEDVFISLNKAKKRLQDKRTTFNSALSRMRLNHIL